MADMTRDVRPGVLFQDPATEQQRNLDEQVKVALDRACEAGRFDASLFTPEQLAAGRQQMERSAQASQNLLASYGLL